MDDVTVIIPSYGRHDLTVAAVEHLWKQSAPPAEVIVVDDGSGVPFSHRGVRVLRHDANRGFAAAVNTGVSAAVTPLVAVLNNDVTLDATWLERLRCELSTRPEAFTCGKIFQTNGRLDGTWDLLCRGGLAWRAGSGRVDHPCFANARNVRFTSFTAMMVRRAAWEPLDESYGTYYEDVEWSLRMALRGHTGRYVPDATSVHLGSATAGAGSAFTTRQLLRNHRRLAHQYLLPAYAHEYRVARTLFRSLCLQRGSWPILPNDEIAAKPQQPKLDEILRESEDEIARIQEATGWDTLWRWYFRLV